MTRGARPSRRASWNWVTETSTGAPSPRCSPVHVSGWALRRAVRRLDLDVLVSVMERANIMSLLTLSPAAPGAVDPELSLQADRIEDLAEALARRAVLPPVAVSCGSPGLRLARGRCRFREPVSGSRGTGQGDLQRLQSGSIAQTGRLADARTPRCGVRRSGRRRLRKDEPREGALEPGPVFFAGFEEAWPTRGWSSSGRVPSRPN